MLFGGGLINAADQSSLIVGVDLMSEFIVAGLIVILGVNGLYSRFCETRRHHR